MKAIAIIALVVALLVIVAAYYRRQHIADEVGQLGNMLVSEALELPILHNQRD